MGTQPDSRLVQLSAPRQKKFALRREDINECFLEFTIKPGEVVLFSHAILRCHKQELFGSQVPIGNQLWSRIPLDRKIHATEEGHAARRVRPNFLAQLLGLLAEQRSQQQRPQDYLKEIASLLSRVRGRMR
jgi:hypothetical protein